MIANKITERRINSRNTEGHVGCIFFGPLHTVSVTRCKMSCSKFAGIRGGYLFCGKEGTNRVLQARTNPTLWQVLRSYGCDDRGCL